VRIDPSPGVGGGGGGGNANEGRTLSGDSTPPRPLPIKGRGFIGTIVEARITAVEAGTLIGAPL
jgi:hypothetical protein